jgi:hypothetical protein
MAPHYGWFGRADAEFAAALGIHVALSLQYLCRPKMADLVARSKHHTASGVPSFTC